MKVTSRRLTTLEAKLRPAPSAEPKPWVLFQTSRSDPNLFEGPDGVQLTDEQVTAYQVANGCRVLQVVLDRTWPEGSL